MVSATLFLKNHRSQRSGCFLSCFTWQKSSSFSRFSSWNGASEPASVLTNQMAAAHTSWTQMHRQLQAGTNSLRWNCFRPELQLQKPLRKRPKQISVPQPFPAPWLMIYLTSASAPQRAVWWFLGAHLFHPPTDTFISKWCLCELRGCWCLRLHITFPFMQLPQCGEDEGKNWQVQENIQHLVNNSKSLLILCNSKLICWETSF